MEERSSCSYTRAVDSGATSMSVHRQRPRKVRVNMCVHRHMRYSCRWACGAVG